MALLEGDQEQDQEQELEQGMEIESEHDQGKKQEQGKEQEHDKCDKRVSRSVRTARERAACAQPRRQQRNYGSYIPARLQMCL